MVRTSVKFVEDSLKLVKFENECGCECVCIIVCRCVCVCLC